MPAQVVPHQSVLVLPTEHIGTEPMSISVLHSLPLLAYLCSC